MRRSLDALEKSLARPASQIGRAGRNRSEASEAMPRRKMKLSPARVKALQLHGRYLGFMRQLKPKAKRSAGNSCEEVG